MPLEPDALASLIGQRVRAERTALGWSLDRLADVATVSRRMVVNVEQGAVNPSIGTLLRLSDALGIGLAALVQPPEPAIAQVTPAGSGTAFWRGEHGGVGTLLTATDAPDVVELWDWTMEPGDALVSEPHTDGTQELLHVLEGALNVRIDGTNYSLSRGDAIAFAGSTAHEYRNDGDATTRFTMTVFEPGVGAARRMESPHA